ncbi:MAG: hypothetical protein ACLQVG_05980 [Terriglobia bacterium]
MMDPQESTTPPTVELPAPTAWPVVLAFGLTLLFAGLLTSAAVSVLGAILAVAGSAGWFRQVLPHEQFEAVPVAPEAVPVVTVRREVVRIEIVPELHRARLPIEIYPVSAGIKGGLAGSVAMAALASLFGVVTHRSIWYPINLLASIVYAHQLQLSLQNLTSFHPELLLVATALHLVTSVLVGLVYGVMLPMFPRRPILLGGFLAPLMWSGLLYTSLGIINPLLDQRIDWRWFVASQIGFGVVAGLVVVRQELVRTRQFMPFAVLAGIEAPGIMDEKNKRSDG